MYPYIEIKNHKIATFPFVILLALLLTALFYIHSKKYAKQFVLDVLKKALPILIGAGIGARLTSAITLMQTSDKSFFYNLLYGGSVFYGGVIGGCLGLLLVCSLRKQAFLDYSDVFLSVLPLGHAIGRIGCYLNGCCYGCEYTGFLSVKYIVDGQATRVFPTWFIEAAFCVLIFAYFQVFCRSQRRGIITAIYFLSYAPYRFLIELMRGDEIRGRVAGLSSSQWISIFILFLGILIFVYSKKNNVNNYLFVKENCQNET